MSDSDLIATRFSLAASTYEYAATVQRQAAQLFANWLAQHVTVQPNSIVEIGCGTGFLSRHLQQHYQHAHLHLTDISREMLAQCRQALPISKKLSFAQVDGRYASFYPIPDWIVSTMCFQWFDDLPQTITKHCAQTRLLAFSVLLDGSFAQWKQAHYDLHQQDGLRVLPKENNLLSFLNTFSDWSVQYKTISLLEHYENGPTFVKALRDIGATQPRAGYRPINLRPLFKIFERGFDAEYRIGFFLLRKKT